MNNENAFYKLLALSTSLGSMNNSYGDLFMFSDEKLMPYSVSLVMEIDDLLEKGYSKEKVIDLIKGADFTLNDPELTKEEAEYLKNYSLRMLEVRYKLYTEEKNKAKEKGIAKSLKKNTHKSNY